MRLESLESRVLLHHHVDHALNSHVHSYLTIYFDNVRQTIPMDVGVGPGLIAPIHTHDTTGKLHVEPAEATYDLVPPTRFPNVGDFFEAWRTHGGNAGNNPSAFFNSTRILDRVADASHTVRFYVNGALNTDYENYILRDGDDLVISYDTLGAATRPSLVPIADTHLEVGSPLLISLDGSDAQGGPLTYTATVAPVSGIPQVTATIPQGNRSARVRVQNFGDMVFQLLDDKTPRVTNHFAQLADLDVIDGQGNVKKFHHGVTFHRVIDGFVIQGGDPQGTGRGDSPLPNFDDQFHVDLQHNRRGLLSMAKSLDDTNDSQFFLTDTPIPKDTTPNPRPGLGSATDGYPRSLDYNHSVFGVLVEGENVREQISSVPVAVCNPGPAGCQADKPLTDVVIDSVTIFNDTENAVLLLKAPPGASGVADVTVTVRDPQNNTFQRTFQVTVSGDDVDAWPFLDDIPKLTTPVGTPVTVPLTARDADGIGQSARFVAAPPAGITTGSLYRDVAIAAQSASTSFTFTPAPTALGTYAIHFGVYNPGLDPSNIVPADLQNGGPRLKSGEFDGAIDRQVVLVSVTRTVTCAIADITDDGRVNRADLAMLSQSLGGTVTAGTGADIDGDGRVNTRDVRWIKQFFGQNCPAASPTAPDGVRALAEALGTPIELRANHVDAAFAQSKDFGRTASSAPDRPRVSGVTHARVLGPSDAQAAGAYPLRTRRTRAGHERPTGMISSVLATPEPQP